MGCACLRGNGHPWPVRGAGGAAARRRQTAGLTYEPDAAGSDACAQLLRRRGDADAVWLGDSQGQPDANPNTNAVPDAVGVGQPVRDRDRQRLGDTLPVTVCHGDGITVAERHRETFGLALAS